MSTSSYADLVTRLAEYRAAEARALKAQEYTVGQGSTARRARRADLAQIQAGIRTVEQQIAVHPDNPARRGSRVRYLRPLG